METEKFKHLLTPVNLHDNQYFYVDYNCNLYRGCNHGCIYCDSRSTCYQMKRFDTVRAKENVIEMLRGELRSKKKTGVIGIGAASDSYNIFEKEQCITRKALEVIQKERFGITLSTKSALVARDADLFALINKHAPVGIALSITTADDALSSTLEPHASLSSERFSAMQTLSDNGVFCGTWLNPMLPFITDTKENITRLAEKTAKAGGRYLLCFFGMTLRDGSRDYFFKALDKHFPGLKERYAKAYGNAYIIDSPDAQTLYAHLKKECQRRGLLYRFEEINKEMMRPRTSQLSLF
jgi:DNA repair photolyase